MSFTFSYDYLLEQNTHGFGMSPTQLSEALETLRPLATQIQDQKKGGSLGFTKLPYQTKADLEELQNLAKAVRVEFENVIIVGIGGSDLGTRAVHRALNHQFYNLRNNPRIFFLGDTTDPVAIQEVLDVVELSRTAFIIISKSGNTVEQMSTFVYIRHLLQKEVGEQANRHIIILTDANEGTLRELVIKEGYRSLVVPGDVGGRFSVLTSVGLFPLAVAGIDIVGLLAGAKSMDEHDSSAPLEQNMPAQYAVQQIAAYHLGHPISVLMPYTYSLREIGFWFRQLWAESLGKKVDLHGKVVHEGPTPIAAVGPTDQHSQVQLYMEGPNDKIFTFITIKNPSTNMTLPEANPDLEGVAYLKGHDFNEIVLAEQKATAYALAQEGRLSTTIELGELNAFSLGQLLYFFELAVTYAGAILSINTFDQPGVEIGKQYMYNLLGRAGFEDKVIIESDQNAHIIL